MKILNAEQREALLDKINGRLILASTSGGKDSGAMSLLLKELEIEHERMFMDTGWEKLALYHYVLRREQMNREAMKDLYGPRTENGDLIRPLTDAELDQRLDKLDRRYGGEAPLQKAIGHIRVVRGPYTFQSLVRKKGMFPYRTARFCTEELKVKPAIEYIKARIADGAEVLNAVGIRAEAKGEELQNPPTMFTMRHWIDNPAYQCTDPDCGIEPDHECPPAKIEKHICKPIDEVVAWAKTSRGGKQFMLLDNGPNEGCMRWGLCDTGRKTRSDE